MSARSVSPSLRHLPASLPVEEGRKNGGQVLHCHFSSGAMTWRQPGLSPYPTLTVSSSSTLPSDSTATAPFSRKLPASRET
jgi:hypothetical protein